VLNYQNIIPAPSTSTRAPG